MMKMHYGDKQLESYQLYEVKISNKKASMKDRDLKTEDSINQEFYSVKGKMNTKIDASQSLLIPTQHSPINSIVKFDESCMQ